MADPFPSSFLHRCVAARRPLAEIQSYNQPRLIFFIWRLDPHHRTRTNLSRRAARLSVRTRIYLGDPFVSFRLFSYAKPCDINGRLLVFSSDPLYIGSLSPVLTSSGPVGSVVFN